MYKKYTKHEFLNKLIESSKDGTFPSSLNGTCFYRKDKNNNCKQRCAIGLLIPDELYYEKLESRTIEVIISDYALFAPEDLSVNDAREIQFSHDYFGFRDSFIWDSHNFIAKLINLPYFSDSISQDLLTKELMAIKEKI